MITYRDRMTALLAVKLCLIKAHDEIEGTVEFFESQLPSEYDRATSREYGTVCRTLGILEEQIASIGNQINQLNIYEKGES